MGEKLTKAQERALAWLAGCDEAEPLFFFLNAGHSRSVIMPLCNRGLITWESATRMQTNVTLAEFEHAQITTSYLLITEAGRLALKPGAQQ